MRLSKILAALLIAIVCSYSAKSQVTTGTITGLIKDAKGAELSGATVEAVHESSGSVYRSISSKTGRFSLPGLRIGGPYKVTVTYVGFKKQEFGDLFVQLGEPTKIDVLMIEEGKNLQEVVVTGGSGKSLISKDRKGASTNLNRRILQALPTLSRSFTDLTKLTPQASVTSNGISFGGQDSRFINLTIDGSIFNNSFGLQSLPGSQTNATPISLDAIEEVQVNLSPYNLKDAGFTGASINAVTRSGTNTLHGSAFYNTRDQGYVGRYTKTGYKHPFNVNVANFDVKQFGASLGGALIKNKLFFFLNGEAEKRTDPATFFVADNGTNTGGVNTSRVKESDLITLSDFLKNKFDYDPGPYQGYSFLTKSYKLLAKIDWNINDKNKFSIRFNSLRASRDVPSSTSGALGGAGRRDNVNTMNYANENYEINNDIYSIIGQLNSRISNKVSNEIIFGWTANRDYRAVKGSKLFPLVDILDGTGADRNYISFGAEPFTPNNKLFTDTWQFSDNINIYSGKHTISTGVNFESFRFFNSFTPQYQGQYIFNSLADFYTSANAYLANPNMSQNPVNLRRYILSYSNVEGGGPWNAITRARNIGAYIQDEVALTDKFNITYGVRFDVPFFANTGFINKQVDGYSFVDETGNPTTLSTSKLPTAKLMINPRFGYNYDLSGDKKTQIRGGFGFFAGRPAFVFISNVVGNNGVLNGQINQDNTKLYPFSPDITRNIPSNIVPGTPAASYNIAPVEKNFRFPQVFKTNFAIDQKLFRGIVGSAEFLFTQSVSNIFYYNANIKPAIATFNGPDNRPRFAGSASAVRINPNITDATVLASRPYGQSMSVTVKLEKPLRKGLSWMVAYNFGKTKDYLIASTIANSSWQAIRSVNGNNLPDLAFSDNDVRHRVVGNITYRTEIAKTAAFQISLFGQIQNQGRFSYTYSGDMNGDGVSGNDLIYIPKNQGEMNFEEYKATIGGVLTVLTAQVQKDAFEVYIQQDSYLRNHRGEYAKRNGVLQPMLARFDLSTMLELFRNIGKNRNSIQIRADIFNVGNLIKHNWGVGDFFNTGSPLAARPTPSNGVPLFRYNVVSGSINYKTYIKSTSINDVWQAQLGVRYIF